MQMEIAKDVEYFGSTVNKNESLGDELGKRDSQARKVVGTLKATVRNKSVSMEVKKILHNCVLVFSLMNGSET